MKLDSLVVSPENCLGGIAIECRVSNMLLTLGMPLFRLTSLPRESTIELESMFLTSLRLVSRSESLLEGVSEGEVEERLGLFKKLYFA